MDSIRNQRYTLRSAAAQAMARVDALEFAMVKALEQIAEALGLDKDAQPEGIAEVAEAVARVYAPQTKNVEAVYGVLAENGLPGVGIVDGVRALAGRAQTALQDQKVLAERLREMEQVAQQAREDEKRLRELLEEQRLRGNQLERDLENERKAGVAILKIRAGQLDNWINTANRHCANEQYYRALLVKIGEMLGPAAKTSDDGSVQQDVLVAKVPELVEKLIETSSAPKPAVDEAAIQFRQKTWTRTDCSISVGGFTYNYWVRAGVGRWCVDDFANPTYPGKPGISDKQMADKIRRAQADAIAA